MKTSVKKLGIDMGNSTICVAALVGDEIKREYVKSVYSLDTAITSGDVINVKDVKIALGTGQTSLTNIDKTNRELVEHQILWAVNSMYGPGQHYIEICVGLPIRIYKAKKAYYTDYLNKIGTIEGEINNKPISVNIVSAKVTAEGYASIKPLAKHINKDNTTMIIDIGMKTTDIILISHNGAKFAIEKYDTIPLALYDIYQALRDNIVSMGVDVSVEFIDDRFKSVSPIIRTEQGEYNLNSRLIEAKHICLDILKAIENKFGKIILHDKIFTGGGASKFLKAVGDLPGNISIDEDLRYYSNALGYLLELQ